MIKLGLFDIDGTLTETSSGAQFGRHPQDFILRELGKRGLALLPSDALVVGCTNQLGVTLGHKTLGECIEEQQYKLSLIERMESIFFCPDYGDSCSVVYRDGGVGHLRQESLDSFRKPGPGMLIRAMQKYNAKPDETLFFGDLPSDREAAQAAGVRYIDLSSEIAFKRSSISL